LKIRVKSHRVARVRGSRANARGRVTNSLRNLASDVKTIWIYNRRVLLRLPPDFHRYASVVNACVRSFPRDSPRDQHVRRNDRRVRAYSPESIVFNLFEEEEEGGIARESESQEIRARARVGKPRNPRARARALLKRSTGNRAASSQRCATTLGAESRIQLLNNIPAIPIVRSYHRPYAARVQCAVLL